jgi:hypothetical protein
MDEGFQMMVYCARTWDATRRWDHSVSESATIWQTRRPRGWLRKRKRNKILDPQSKYNTVQKESLEKKNNTRQTTEQK